MYQIEVKRQLVAHLFRPSDGWIVTVHLDAMELANGGEHPSDKQAIAATSREWLTEQGVVLSAHEVYGRADLVAIHPKLGTFVVEVEGDSARQKEQSLYSALGQAVTVMGALVDGISFGIAFPDTPNWERQVKKIPAEVCRRLNLHIWLASPSGAREFQPV